MTRFIMPIILIGISITIFFVFTNPIYSEISILNTQAESYNEALGNSKSLENERDKLTAKYNSISKDNLLKLEKLLPENIDNIRLILEIEKIASPYGMILKGVKYSTLDTKATTKNPTSGAVNGASSPSVTSQGNKDYGVWDLEFSTTSTYDNFLSFTRDLESNLRIVDISSVAFSSSGEVKTGVNNSLSDVYTYNFKIKTYWLKN
jgi:Tfp pilus assembly protein PilO